ncbi:MAG: porin family protein [Parachlamydiaceae bacterium]|nr:porin family protein [Parachlamydiaceae bacterium]
MFALLMTAMSLASFAPAQADNCCWDSCCGTDGFYVSGFGGANFIAKKKHIDFKTGYVVGGAVGYAFCNNLRLEGEVSYRHNRIKSVSGLEDFSGFSESVSISSSASSSSSSKSHFTTLAYMANVYYDIDTSCWDCCCGCGEIVPYIGAGIGYNQQRLRISEGEFNLNGKKSGFAWQLIAGLAYEITPCADISLEYRFLQGSDKKLYNHAVAGALRYKF